MRYANWLFLSALALLLSSCRTPTPPATLTPYASATPILATRTSIILPSRLPTLTPMPTHAPTATTTPTPTFTAAPTRPPVTTTGTSETASASITATLDPVGFYQQASVLCESAFVTTTVLTTTQSGNHLPTFILINQPYASIYWEPLTGLEWIDADATAEVKSVVCLRASRRQDATYSDQTVGYTLKWDVRLLSWPDGWLIASESFWGDGPPRQNASGAIAYGKSPSEQLLTWLACDLQPENASILCQGRGPLAFAPDGQTLIAGREAWNVAEKQKTAAYDGFQSDVGAMALSPNGSTVANAGVGEREIHLWQASSGQLLHRLSGHQGEVTALAFSPDSQWLLSAAQDGSARVWNAQSGELKQTLAENLGWLHAAAISPDGKLAAIGSWAQPGLVYVWDFQAAIRAGGSREPIHTIEASKVYLNALAFSPDNLLLASAGLDGSIRLWDAATALDPEAGMRLVGLLQGHSNSVNSLAFAPDGKRLASGGDDCSVIIWDVASGQPWRTLTGALNPVISVAYSRTGQWLAASNGKLVKIWPGP